MVTELKNKLICLAVVVCCASFLVKKCCSKRTMYFSLERPRIAFVDPECCSDVIFKARLASRSDPVHYVTVNYTLKKVGDNNFTVSLYFYQLLSNVYKRSFVEVHVKFCDLMERDTIFGDALREGFYRIPEKERVMPELKCPALPGRYSHLNMRFRFAALMDHFPFQEGRIYINVTYRGRPAAQGSIDFHIKALRNANK